MNGACGKEWTRKFIRDSFTQTFTVGPLKKWRENLLFEKERALLPATQPYVEAVHRRNEIDREIHHLLSNITKINRSITTLRIEYNTLERNPLAILNVGGATINSSNEVREIRQFIKPCPADECRGFLSSQWKCGTCNVWTCPECHCVIGENKDAEHTCDPNNVETAKMLKKETKPCPKCHACIYKIDGCDQMWCTQCHTAFSWKSGKIETTVHNPHYYEWLRRTQGEVPRNPLDMRCGQNRLDGHISRGIDMLMRTRKLDKITPELYKYCQHKMSLMERNVLHYRLVAIPRFQNFDYERNNRELRIKYLMNETDEQNLKVELQRAEKKTLKDAEIREVYEMVCNTAEDIIFRFYAYIEMLPLECQTWNSSILDEMNPMLEYANECIKDICKTYHCKLNKFMTSHENFMRSY